MAYNLEWKNSTADKNIKFYSIMTMIVTCTKILILKKNTKNVNIFMRFTDKKKKIEFFLAKTSKDCTIR